VILARVVGTVVATRKDPRLEGCKLLLVKPITPEGKDEGSYLIAHGRRLQRKTGGSGDCRHRRFRGFDLRLLMYLGRVVGRVWSTVKDAGLTSQRLLIVQPLRAADLSPVGRRIVCTDGTNTAGSGDLIYWCGGKEASFPFLPAEVPTNTTIVGIVDEVHVQC
jgi:ethanolamine utilization protein EutN